MKANGTIPAGVPEVSAAHGHAVQFFDREYGAASIAGYLAEALRAGAGALVIARSDHRTAIVEALVAAGVDPVAAADGGRLVLIDAGELLERVCVGGEPRTDLLRRHVGPVLARLAESHAEICAYGEMVDLLAGAGRIEAAVALERSWNEVLAEYPAKLLCSYHLAAFDLDGDGAGFRGVCDAHAEVRAADPAGAAGLSRDRLIAELEQRSRAAAMAADAAHRAREDAERANRAKDEFLAMLGHELRNPLAPILTTLELMKLRDGGVLERERAVIERQVSHLLRLVEDLLDVSRITRGKIQLERTRIEISEVVAQAIESVGPLIEQRRHRLMVSVPPKGLAVDGDPSRLAQVVANLLGNAAKFTPGAGRLEVEARADGAEVVLRVADDGAGIAPELLPTIFDSFTQGPRSRARSEGGLGLGLAIARSLVELHGGSVTAGSEGHGRGAEFVVRLPLAERQHGFALVQPAATAPAAPARDLRVLVVDDNVDAARTLAELLETMGCETGLAHDGPSALIAAQELAPDLVLLDIGLPVMDGYEVACRLRELPGSEELRIVAVTGYGQATDRERSRQSGFDGHLVKPLAPEHLRELLDGLAPAAEEREATA